MHKLFGRVDPIYSSIFLLYLMTSTYVILLTSADSNYVLPTPVGKWSPVDPTNNNTMWRKACDFTRNFGYQTSSGVKKMDSLASCAAYCFNSLSCSHFVFINDTTCYTKFMPYALWPVDVGHRKYQKLYACGYVPHKMLTEDIFWNKRCVFPSDWEKIELPRGYDNMPVYWLSLLNDLVNMTLSLKTFGIPNYEIKSLKKQKLPLYQAMKCIFSQEKINAEVEMSLKLAINYLNKSDCPWMHPFDQSYNVDMYMYNRTVGLTLKGTFDLRSTKRKWITSTYLSSYHKSMATNNLEVCLRRRMTPPPVLIDKIIRDPVMNRAIVKTFISKAMRSNLDYYFGQFSNVDRYFFALQRMMCLVQSLLKNGCIQPKTHGK